MTVAVTDAFSGNSSDNYFIYGIRSKHDSKGYFQTLTIVGGSASGVTEGTQVPFAVFTYKLEVEFFNSKMNYVLMLDGSGSYDPDGTIVSYSWSDGTDTKSGAIVTYIYDVADATKSITLTVTDADANIGTITRDIPLTADTSTALTRVLYLATSTGASVSRDGGQSWANNALS
jgi:hypothetical protein